MDVTPAGTPALTFFRHMSTHMQLIEIGKILKKMPLEEFTAQTSDHADSIARDPNHPLRDKLGAALASSKRMAQAAILFRDAFIEMGQELEKAKTGVGQ